MDNVAYLISQTFKKDALGQLVPGEETRSEILISISSVNRAEFFSAGRSGLNPEFVFETPTINYSGEKVIEFEGKRYAIYRIFNIPNTDNVELYLQKEAGVV